jgi:arsenate reductase
MLFIEYPKCSTCKKAKKYLIDNNIDFTERDITKDIPTKEELKKYLNLTDHKNINKFFNTSGIKYRELNLKDKLPTMTLEEKIDLLSSDGMLIKRPLLVLDNNILLGFKEKEYQTIIKQ